MHAFLQAAYHVRPHALMTWVILIVVAVLVFGGHLKNWIDRS
jgi:hypothetical protein